MPLTDDLNDMYIRPSGSRLPEEDEMSLDNRNGRSAARAQADIAREEYLDYLQRFNPTRRRLASMYDNPVLRREAVSDAGAQVRTSFDALPEQRERRMEGLNITLDGQQRESMERQDNLAESLAMVGAKNRAQRAFDDRNEQIAVGINPGRIANERA